MKVESENELEENAETAPPQQFEPIVPKTEPIDDDEDVVEQPTTSADFFNNVTVKEEGEVSDSEPDDVDSEEEYQPSDEGEESSEGWIGDGIDKDEDELMIEEPRIKKRKVVRQRDKPKFVDDSDDRCYEKRLSEKIVDLDEEYHTFCDDLKLPKAHWEKLFKYQQKGVRWLAHLDTKSVGGILADDMGLGKTIQLISFLKALHISKRENLAMRLSGLGTVLLMCPATVICQWVEAFHEWFPECRVVILHRTGPWSRGARKLLKTFVGQKKTIIVTTYSTFLTHKQLIVSSDWHYAVLDEGHAVKNPEAQVSMSVRELLTPHRIILSGSPIQNSLKELWSLVDFVFPGRLGSLQNFVEKFVIPISHGGYATSTNAQKSIASHCARVLRDSVQDLVLRRLKKDMAEMLGLPMKKEKVVFCQLTEGQRRLYEGFLKSGECDKVQRRDMKRSYAAITKLRQLCNHCDIYMGTSKSDENFGFSRGSGKMLVLKTLLKIWVHEGLKVLVFSQSVEMLDILEKMHNKHSIKFIRMDGSTSISVREKIIEQFDKEPEACVFLLTTKVGGVGLNLTAAKKVVLFDPDWNPTTDAQARDRVFRIGQTDDVEIVRLITAGTIEEKIYQRQVHKDALGKRVLTDPNQAQVIDRTSLQDLFTLGSHESKFTETGTIFAEHTETTAVLEKNEERDKKSKKSKHETKKRKSVEKEEIDETRCSVERNEEGSAKEGDEKKKKKKNGDKKSGTVKKSDFVMSHVVECIRVDGLVDDVIKGQEKHSEHAIRQAKQVAQSAASLVLQKPSSWLEEGRQRRDANGSRGFKAAVKRKANTGTKMASAEIEMLAERLREYFLKNGGESTTQRVMDKFNTEKMGQTQALQFRELLREMATLVSKKHKWVLNEKYKKN